MSRYFFICIAFISVHLSAQVKSDIYPIAFYNLENLFDTNRDNNIQDEDFTPQGKYQWTEDKYNKKLNNLADVISQLGRQQNKDGFAILGVAEVENRKVMEDLILKTKLSETKYQIVHQDSPDARGIDVGMIYNPQYFKVKTYRTYPFTLPGNNNIRTRDILVVSGLLAGEPISILVNHWPSRRGEDSSPLRERAGSICKHISDSIYNENPKTAIVIMGDMNDDPKDKSTSIALGAKKEMNQVKEGGLFNTLWKTHESGRGTLCYRGEWNLFDQIIISQSLLKSGKSNLNYIKSEIFTRDYMYQQSGKYKGYPLRTLSGNTFLNGYSDHFPTLIYIGKAEKQ